MKATKNWPPEASFLVDWLEKNKLIEEVEEIINKQKELVFKYANDMNGIESLFDFSKTKDTMFWVRRSIEYSKAYHSAKLSGGYKDFYKLTSKD